MKAVALILLIVIASVIQASPLEAALQARLKIAAKQGHDHDHDFGYLMDSPCFPSSQNSPPFTKEQCLAIGGCEWATSNGNFYFCGPK